MVYRDKFVAVVKCNGQVLRERGEDVNLPFGSEYSLLLKNLESRRVSVDIQIDGKDVLNGSSLIILPNEEFELKGFLEGMSVRNRFKFIKKTKQIQDYRGDRIDDGIIRIEYAFEKRKPERKTIIHEHHYHERHYDYYPPLFRSLDWTNDGIIGGSAYNINSNLSSLSSSFSSKGDISFCCLHSVKSNGNIFVTFLLPARLSFKCL